MGCAGAEEEPAPIARGYGEDLCSALEELAQALAAYNGMMQRTLRLTGSAPAQIRFRAHSWQARAHMEAESRP